MTVRVVVLLAIAVCAWGQATEYEIRGAVTEVGTGAPIAGIEVVVTDFIEVGGVVTPRVLGSVLTDVKGNYRYVSDHEGQFLIEAKMPGYKQAPADGFDLNKDHPIHTHDFQFYRTAELRGRMEDGEGRALAGFVFTLTESSEPRGRTIQTDDDGTFRVTNLPPGTYRVLVRPQRGSVSLVTTDFKEEDTKAVDEDYEYGFYPGAIPREADAPRIALGSGAVVDLPTMVIRKVPYFRAVLTYGGKCSEGERWTVSVPQMDTVGREERSVQIPCRPSLLLKMLRPKMPPVVITTQSDEAGRFEWARIDTAGDRNGEFPIRFLPSIEVPVKIGLPRGQPPTQRTAHTVLREQATGLIVTLSGFDKTALLHLVDGDYTIAAAGEKLELREVRYGSEPLRGPLRPLTGVVLEIVLDSPVGGARELRTPQ